MTPTDLRTAAARHFLGLTDREYLLDVAHAALDRGIYAHGLAEIISSREPMLADLGPYFDSALSELGLAVSNWDEAINRTAQGYMVKIIEGDESPYEVAYQGYFDYIALCNDPDLPMGSSERESLRSLGSLLATDLRVDFYRDEPDRFDQERWAQIDQSHVEIASNWCREHWLPSFDPSWLTTTVMALAQGIRAERAFDRLPILADALQDAGCDHTDILDHCRGNGPHVRGCWVVDLVLRKS